MMVTTAFAASKHCGNVNNRLAKVQSQLVTLSNKRESVGFKPRTKACWKPNDRIMRREYSRQL